MFNSAKIKTVKTKMRMLRVSENENGHFSREKYSRNIRLCSPFWRINLPNPGKGRRKEGDAITKMMRMATATTKMMMGKRRRRRRRKRMPMTMTMPKMMMVIKISIATSVYLTTLVHS